MNRFHTSLHSHRRSNPLPADSELVLGFNIILILLSSSASSLFSSVIILLLVFIFTSVRRRHFHHVAISSDQSFTPSYLHHSSLFNSLVNTSLPFGHPRHLNNLQNGSTNKPFLFIYPSCRLLPAVARIAKGWRGRGCAL